MKLTATDEMVQNTCGYFMDVLTSTDNKTKFEHEKGLIYPIIQKVMESIANYQIDEELSPGFLATEFSKGALSEEEVLNDLIEHVQSQINANHAGDPEYNKNKVNEILDRIKTFTNLVFRAPTQLPSQSQSSAPSLPSGHKKPSAIPVRVPSPTPPQAQQQPLPATPKQQIHQQPPAAATAPQPSTQKAAAKGPLSSAPTKPKSTAEIAKEWGYKGDDPERFLSELRTRAQLFKNDQSKLNPSQQELLLPEGILPSLTGNFDPEKLLKEIKNISFQDFCVLITTEGLHEHLFDLIQLLVAEMSTRNPLEAIDHEAINGVLKKIGHNPEVMENTMAGDTSYWSIRTSEKNSIRSPLQAALYAGAPLHIIEHLLKIGFAKNQSLLLALSKNNLEMIKLFIKYGANIEFAMQSQSAATEIKSKEALKILLDAGASAKPFFDLSLPRAIERGDKDFVDALWTSTKYHPTEKNLNTALYSAVKSQQTELVKFFIEKGADPTQQVIMMGRKKNTIAEAKALGNKEIITLIDNQASKKTEELKAKELEAKELKAKEWLAARALPHKRRTTEESLEKNLNAAIEDHSNEPDKSFVLLNEPSPSLDNNPTINIGEHSVGKIVLPGLPSVYEDTCIVQELKVKVGKEHSISGNEETLSIPLYGVFDGFGGDATAKFLADNMGKKLAQKLAEQWNTNGYNNESTEKALKQCCIELSEEYTKLNPSKNAKSTAIFSIILNGFVWTANVGDSRATYVECGSSRSKTTPLSQAAKATHYRFKRHIEKHGGKVGNRVADQLAPARSFGVSEYGNSAKPNPKITRHFIADNYEGSYLVLACDSFYKVTSNNQLGKAIESLQKRKDMTPGMMSLLLAQSAITSGAKDNISVVVVKLL